MCSWYESLRQALAQTSAADRPPRLALVGLGSELRGDDAAGLLVVRALQPCLSVCENVLVLESGTAPESCCGPLRRFRPDLIVFIDAAVMGQSPDCVQWLDWHNATDGVATHGFPLSLLAQYLSLELDCQIAILGIQPTWNDFGAALSLSVAQAVANVVQMLSLLRPDNPASNL